MKPSNGSSSSSLTITGMQPLTIASNNLADDGVSPAGLRQKMDLTNNKKHLAAPTICTCNISQTTQLNILTVQKTNSLNTELSQQSLL